MKLAVTYENGMVFQHFGHTAQFKIYEIQNGEVISQQVVDTNGSGHGALADFLAQLGVNELICGGIGGGAQNALGMKGIRLMCGVTGDADLAVKSYLENRLQFASFANCSHHDHDNHGESCGNHGCGGSCHH